MENPSFLNPKMIKLKLDIHITLIIHSLDHPQVLILRKRSMPTLTTFDLTLKNLTIPNLNPNQTCPITLSQVNPKQNVHYKPPSRPRRVWAHRHYTVEEEEIQKLSKAYIGVVENPGMSYNIQEEFIQQGYFSIRATPMGSNLVLLESLEEGETEALIEDAQGWLSTWFKDV